MLLGKTFFATGVLLAAVHAFAESPIPTDAPVPPAQPQCETGWTLIKAASVFCPFETAVTKAEAKVSASCNSVESPHVTCNLRCELTTGQLNLMSAENPPRCTADGQKYLGGCQPSPNPVVEVTHAEVGYKKFAKANDPECEEYAEEIDCSPAVAQAECSKGIDGDIVMVEQHGSGLCCNEPPGGPAPSPGTPPVTPPIATPSETQTAIPEETGTSVAPEPSWSPTFGPPEPSPTPAQPFWMNWF